MNAFEWLFGQKASTETNADLDGGRYLADLYRKDSIQANFMQKIITAINKVGRAAGVSPVGEVPAPSPINAINIKAAGELVHITLSHNVPVTRPINYFVEADTSPSFTHSHVMDLKSSRSHFVTLPSLNDSGQQQPWYFRAYAQYPGSKPSTPTVAGGINEPQAVTLLGATRLTPLTSTGSGTASPNGQQSGWGMGKQFESSPQVNRIGSKQASQSQVNPPSASGSMHLLAAIASASSTTTLSQSGTSTTINVGAGNFFFAGQTVSTQAGSVNPGSYGTWFIYHDDPQLAGGNVIYQATSDVTDLGKAFGRFYDGKITTTSAGGGSGGGGNGGGGRGGTV